MVSYVDPRAAVCYGDCSESMPSSAASEDTLDLPEADISSARLQNAVSVLLQGIGEDVEREGLRDTPRVRCNRTLVPYSCDARVSNC